MQLLLHSFIEVRRKLPLGYSEYVALLRALECGFGTGSRNELIFTCQALWAKTADEIRLVGEIVNHALPPMLSKSEIEAILTEVDDITASVNKVPSNDKSIDQSDFSFADKNEYKQDSHHSIQDFSTQTRNEANNKSTSEPQMHTRWGMGKLEGIIEDPTTAPIPLSRSYEFKSQLPFSKRQTIRILRRFRRMQCVGPLLSLDIHATIERIHRDGVLTEPVFTAQRSNQAELTLLIDQGGSMLPFRTLVEMIIEAALATKLANVSVYYFHDVPYPYIFSDKRLNEGIHLDFLLPKLHNAGVLIISDAGAARGTYHHERILNTTLFVKTLLTATHNIAWLNPLPFERWHGTSANDICYKTHMPMFYLDVLGLEKAVSSLRGQGA